MDDFSLSVKRTVGNAEPYWHDLTVPIISESMSVLDALIRSDHSFFESF